MSKTELYMLGITAGFFNSSAALVNHGDVLAFAEEERFSRKKRTGVLPVKAVEWCLKYARIQPEQIAHIGFSWQPWRGLFNRLIVILRHADSFSRPFNFSDASTLKNLFLSLPRLKRIFDFRCPIHYLNHYSSHVIASVDPSPFYDPAVLIVDGTGEFRTVSYGTYQKGVYCEKRGVNFPHSLGFLYQTLTEYLGYRANRDEGKIMGLSAYGTDRFVDSMKNILTLSSDGDLRTNLDYFDYHHSRRRYFSDRFIDLFGKNCIYGNDFENHHKDVAFAGQSLTENILIGLAKCAIEQTQKHQLCLGGGVFLNSVANGRIRQEVLNDLYVPPWTGDEGGALGAALIMSRRYDSAYKSPSGLGPYLGPEYSEEEIAYEFTRLNVPFKQFKDICGETAKRLADGKLVGWFQGRMEVGPRALGNRSILADPRNPEMKNLLNDKVKHRESYRPYAPVVIKEAAQKYFDLNCSSPYMLLVANVHHKVRDQIPAACHVDGTARIQTVSKIQNPLYYKLISSFGYLTGVPVLLNTSFNAAGEPIICAPKDAIMRFINSDLDVLVMGSLMAEKCL